MWYTNPQTRRIEVKVKVGHEDKSIYKYKNKIINNLSEKTLRYLKVHYDNFNQS